MADEVEEAEDTSGVHKAPGDELVTLRVVIGSGQDGTIRVNVGDTRVASGREKIQVVLGKAAELYNKKVKVFCLVSDVNPMTNRTEVTWIFEGSKPSSFHQQYTVKKDSDFVTYRAEFTIQAV